MEELNVGDSLHNASSWLVRNQELLLSYAVQYRCRYRRLLSSV